MNATIDILIPTYRRPAALAVTLTSLVAQTCRDFRIVISDQTEDSDPVATGEVRTKLRELGGYSFWQELPPEHCGEDVLVQLRLMERYGGCGIIPSGVYHQELPTTIVDRRVVANSVLSSGHS